MTALLSPFDEPPHDPVGLLREWFESAKREGVREPGAIAVATACGAGRASNRMVQTLSIRETGLVFTSHRDSRKGRDIEGTGWASGVFYWRELGQQIVLSGPISLLSDEECDTLWYSRPAHTRPMSVVARQGEVLDDERALRARAQRLADDGAELSRPEGWVGYELALHEIEFWQASPDRLHRRLRYDRIQDGWTSCRLQP